MGNDNSSPDHYHGHLGSAKVLLTGYAFFFEVRIQMHTDIWVQNPIAKSKLRAQLNVLQADPQFSWKLLNCYIILAQSVGS